MFCGQCGANIDEQGQYCTKCGAHAEQDWLAPEGEMYSTLAQANLLRGRRQWEDAIALCVKVLRRYPNNASAHSLLGDVYRDQGMHREAIEWYKLAVELDPANRSDQEKLDGLLDRVYAHQASSPQALTSLPATVAPGKMAHALLGARVSRPALVAILVALSGVSLISAALIAYRQGSRPNVQVFSAVPVGQPQQPVLPRELPPAPEELGTPAGVPTHAAGVRPVAPTPESSLLSQLQSSLDQTGSKAKVVTVVLDPARKTGEISYSAPELESAAATKGSLVRTAVYLAATAVSVHRDLAILRMSGRVSRSTGLGFQAFIGDLEVRSLARPDLESLTPTQLLSLFASPWWHPDYREVPL